jgi:predicted CxxxxCH...CXXCH cytochrome family protein
VICHSPAGLTQGGVELSADPVAALVGVESSAYPGRTLVVPGQPDVSFLVAKVAGAEGDDGDPMPPPAGLGVEDVDLVTTWVRDGALACTSGGGTTPGGGGGGGGGEPPYHPAGWADPGVHGLSAKLQEQDCTTCHGAELDGGSSGVSCDTCHAASWRTTCTYCHGGLENATGAPPENIDDTTDPLPFPAHSAHVEETIHPAYGCDSCHVEPTNPLSPGHVFVADDTPGEPEVAIPGATYTAGSCSNLYCHGDGQGANGTADATFVATCDGCHADGDSPRDRIAAMSGQHERHVASQGFACTECHSRTVDAGGAIADPTVHVDGTPTVAPISLHWNDANRTCDGTCHGESHSNRHWD